MNWIESFPINHAPNTKDIKDYLGSDLFDFYNNYLSYLRNEFGLKYIRQKFCKKDGWYQSIGKSGIIMIKKLVFCDSSFFVNDIRISSKNELDTILRDANTLYNNEFKTRLTNILSKRSLRNKDKRKTEQESLNNMLSSGEIDVTKFNKFKWAKPVTRLQIKNLYLSDAKNMLDERLLDEVGFGFYARCLQAKEERNLIANKKLKCHNCGNINFCNENIISCNCGYKYTFNEYKKSFSNNKMPKGNAIPIFDMFITKWESAKNDIDKMRIIDWIIHEIHLGINGMVGRFVGQQLIEGTGAEIKDLILMLAYSDNSIASVQNLIRFKYYKNEISKNDYSETINNNHA